VNCDCVADATDLELVVAHWRHRVDDPDSDPRYDLDGDGDVDVADTMAVIARWSDSCQSVLGVQKGISYAAWWEGAYQAPEADQSLVNLAATGANWIALIVTGYQETVSSTSITYTPPRTPTDADLIHAIEQAHSLGMKVMLKPHVDLSDDPDHWRGQIRFEDEADWQAWFTSYRDFINHYAELAEANGVEAFVVGVELGGTTEREAEWRQVVAEVRERFSGPITYAANWGGEEVSITWWDAVDYIGVDAYYPLTDKNDPTVQELKAAWRERVTMLRELSRRYGRPVLFTEIGYPSIDGANRAPWAWEGSGPVDPQEQADCYQAAFESFWDEPWFLGAFWWMWWTDPTIGGPVDDSYTPYRKPAEQVLRVWYGASAETVASLPPTTTLRRAPRPAPASARFVTLHSATGLHADNAANTNHRVRFLRRNPRTSPSFMPAQE